MQRAATSQTTKSRAKDIPTPFEPAPSRLKPFLDALDVSQVYIAHLDTFPAKYKKQLFTVPVVLNIAIILLLLLRWYWVLPTYLDILLYAVGERSPAVIDTPSKTRWQLAWIVLRRALTFAIDFALVRIILPWPVTFFMESPANPMLWRRSIGFQDTEVCVRVSRGWSAADLTDGVKQGSDNAFFKTRILPAIDAKYMREKTGYLMMGKDWDLDFNAMIVAHDLVEKKTLAWDDFKKSVFVYYEKHGWLVWPFHKLDEVSEDDAGKKIMEFKDRLTAMGKESLFFRWVELMQYEGSQPGGFTLERQEAAVEKARVLFSEEGVDLDEFLAAVGGTQGFPGMGATT